METWLTWVGVILGAYLLGSIPSGLLIGRLIFGIDPREHGSRRTGATNVLRTMGKKAAFAVLVMDALKSIASVALARLLMPDVPWGHVAAALAVTAGHNWPLFSGFRGGKGVIVSAVAAGMLYWPIFVVLLVVGVAVIWRTRYVSLGSISGAVIAPVVAFGCYMQGLIPAEYLVFTMVGGALVVLTHRENITRLQAGTENRLGQRVQTAG